MFDPGKLVKEIQEMRDDGHLSDALLRHAVREIAPSDDRFDWVGVYLTRDGEEGRELWLHNYIASPTEYAVVPEGAGTRGRALAEGGDLIVNDVPNVEDAQAREVDVLSEMVVLIRAGDEIYGEIDIDSETEAAFTEEDQLSVQAVADKLAEQIAAERR